MQCCFCRKVVESDEEAIKLGWYPDFWHLEISYQGPICPECQKEHLETDEDGEFILKVGHSLPSNAEPIFSVEGSAPIKCLFCDKPVEGIDPFCPDCKREHFIRNENGEEVLKPGHEIPSFPLSILEAQPCPKFSLGQIVATPGALNALTDAGQTPDFFLDKHVQGDWGEVCNGDKKLNEEAIANGERLLSAYRTLKNVRIWVITEADRSSTCLLLPEEY